MQYSTLSIAKRMSQGSIRSIRKKKMPEAKITNTQLRKHSNGLNLNSTYDHQGKKVKNYRRGVKRP
jgi:hypothetical protein